MVTRFAEPAVFLSGENFSTVPISNIRHRNILSRSGARADRLGEPIYIYISPSGETVLIPYLGTGSSQGSLKLQLK